MVSEGLAGHLCPYLYVLIPLPLFFDRQRQKLVVLT